MGTQRRDRIKRREKNSKSKVWRAADATILKQRSQLQGRKLNAKKRGRKSFHLRPRWLERCLVAAGRTASFCQNKLPVCEVQLKLDNRENIHREEASDAAKDKIDPSLRITWFTFFFPLTHAKSQLSPCLQSQSRFCRTFTSFCLCPFSLSLSLSLSLHPIATNRLAEGARALSLGGQICIWEEKKKKWHRTGSSWRAHAHSCSGQEKGKFGSRRRRLHRPNNRSHPRVVIAYCFSLCCTRIGSFLPPNQLSLKHRLSSQSKTHFTWMWMPNGIMERKEKNKEKREDKIRFTLESFHSCQWPETTNVQGNEMSLTVGPLLSPYGHSWSISHLLRRRRVSEFCLSHPWPSCEHPHLHPHHHPLAVSCFKWVTLEATIYNGPTRTHTQTHYSLPKIQLNCVSMDTSLCL